MALNAYLTIEGQRQGRLIGSVNEEGREGSILVIATSHQVVSPRDPASGLPTGKRQHKPFVITKPVDKATPLLYSAFVNNENLTSWRLNFYRPSGLGAEQLYYTVSLTNASIASIHQEMLNNAYDENVPLDVREHIAFTYQRIEWTWQDGGITAMDDWESPVV